MKPDGKSFEAMRLIPRPTSVFVRLRLLCAFLLAAGARATLAQTNPAEITNPELRAAEKAYLPQLIALNRAISTAKFPFSFFPSRYVGLDPKEQLEADSRGVEFVSFHGRTVLKITGNYNAAYNAERLTTNERASRTFTDVVVPILTLVSKEIPADVKCEAIGFEISYHVRQRMHNADYEGKEILVLVFDKADAFGFENGKSDSDRRQILDRTEIYLSGKEFGLALGQRQPFDRRTHEISTPEHPARPAIAGLSLSPAGSGNPPFGVNQKLPPGLEAPGGARTPVAPGSTTAAPATGPEAIAAAATPADAERLQSKHQSELDSLAKAGVADLRFVDYAPPSFVVFRDRTYLQLTLRNPMKFDKETGSIYKRAAQSFDLFLALQLKPMLDKIPADPELVGLDITLLNQLDPKPGGSSEALEFALPMESLRRFVNADITNQELINRSIVLVNGMRIALNLQLAE